jgi:hypothetical protein
VLLGAKRGPGRLDGLRVAGLIALIAGAVGSLGLTLYTGRHNDSAILKLLFAIWVPSPFLVLLWANLLSKRWTVLARVALHSFILALTVASLAIYGYIAFGPPRKQTAFAFLVVPGVSLLVTAILVLVAARAPRRPPPTSGFSGS